MKNKELPSFLINFLKIFILLMICVYPSSAEQAIRGLILSAKTLQPLDSVRVVCVLKEALTYSNPDGNFSLFGVLDTDIHGKHHSIDKNSGYSVRVSMLKPHHVKLFNIKGKQVESFAITAQSSQLNPRIRTPGIYILENPNHTPQKMLITDRTHMTPGVKKNETIYPLQSARYSSDYLISFYKQGYETVSVPASELDTLSPVLLRKKRWIASDIHFHSVLSDGKYTLDQLTEYAFGDGGLDVLMSTEHGGKWARDTSGRYFSHNRIVDPNYPQFSRLDSIPFWYSLINFSWPKLLGQRKLHPDKILLQGLEWNCPGHDHAGIGFINDEDLPDAIAQFEYQFDRKDKDTSRPEWIKNNKTDKDALIALKWLNDNYPRTSFCFINHPSRYPPYKYSINKIRDMIASAPDICLGFEGAPGHQNRGHKGVRGNYIFGNKKNDARTYGGVDPILAHIGGVWDALLSEGRRFWTIANSDFHFKPMDFLPGEYTKTWSVVTDTGAQAWLEGIRSGEVFIVHGNLISALNFYIDDGFSTASIGGDFFTKTEELTIVIQFKPGSPNQNGTQVSVDHIDLIYGKITGKVSPLNTEEYANPKAASTRIYSRFSSDTWVMENGWYTIRSLVDVEQPCYFRLRGTNLAVGTAGELDDNGNPLPDPPGKHSAHVAWNDLWFYSNPIFVYPGD